MTPLHRLPLALAATVANASAPQALRVAAVRAGALAWSAWPTSLAVTGGGAHGGLTGAGDPFGLVCGAGTPALAAAMVDLLIVLSGTADGADGCGCGGS